PMLGRARDLLGDPGLLFAEPRLLFAELRLLFTQTGLLLAHRRLVLAEHRLLTTQHFLRNEDVLDTVEQFRILDHVRVVALSDVEEVVRVALLQRARALEVLALPGAAQVIACRTNHHVREPVVVERVVPARTRARARCRGRRARLRAGLSERYDRPDRGDTGAYGDEAA